MIAAVAAVHCCDGDELRVPGSPQPYARRVRGSWRDYLDLPDDEDLYGDDDDDDDEDSYDDDYGDGCSCCSMCSSGGGEQDSPPGTSSSRSSASSSSSSSSCLSSSVLQVSTGRLVDSPVFEPSMRGSCRCIRCQKRRYSLDFFKSTDFRRGIPSPNVYMIDERSCKIVDNYIHGNPNIIYSYRLYCNFAILVIVREK